MNVVMDASPVEEWAVLTSGFRTLYRPNHLGGDWGTGNNYVHPIFGAEIRAPWDGKVTIGYQAGGAGNWIWVDRGDGVLFKCFHLSSYAVTNGESVKAGQVIGYVGNTGASDGAHYHVEVWVNGVPVNPVPIVEAVRSGPQPSEEDDMALTEQEKQDVAAASAQKVWELAVGNAQAQGQPWAINPATNAPYPNLYQMVTVAGVAEYKELIESLAEATNSEVRWDAGVPTLTPKG